MRTAALAQASGRGALLAAERLIGNLPLFRQVAREHLAHLAKHAIVHRLKRGDVVCRRGEPLDWELGLIDFAFLASTSLKIPDGGWFPILVGAVVFTLLTTWKRGRSILMHRLAEDAMPLDLFVQSIGAAPPTRVPLRPHSSITRSADGATFERGRPFSLPTWRR